MAYQLADWITIKVSGKDRMEYLNGIITIDISKLENEKWYRSALLTPKGKIRSLFWIEKKDDAYYIISHPTYRSNLIEDLLKYNINVSIKLEDLTTELPPLCFEIGSEEIAGLGILRGKFLWREECEGSDFSKLLIRNQACPPEYYMNMHPLEAGMLDSVTLEKGCFLGQETVSRMYNRGKPRSRLVWKESKLSEDDLNDGIKVICHTDDYTIYSVPYQMDIDKINAKSIGVYPSPHQL